MSPASPSFTQAADHADAAGRRHGPLGTCQSQLSTTCSAVDLPAQLRRCEVVAGEGHLYGTAEYFRRWGVSGIKHCARHPLSSRYWRPRQVSGVFRPHPTFGSSRTLEGDDPQLAPAVSDLPPPGANASRPTDEFPAHRARDSANLFTFAFDLLAVGDSDLRGLPFETRRTRLEDLFAAADPPLQLAPSVRDLDEALRWMAPEQANVGIEGVVAKDVRRPYRAGRTGDWLIFWTNPR